MKKLQNILLNTMSKKVLGLDIRYDSVSAVLVKNNIKENFIEAHEYVPISDQNDIAGCIDSLLKSLAKQTDISGSICIASFPANQISYRNIKLPFKEQKKIKQILPYELESTLPFLVDDLIIDYNSIKLQGRSGPVDSTDVIAAAVEKSALKSYLNTLASFNIKPKIVTVGGYPTALCLSSDTTVPENRLFVDMGNRNCSVFILVAGQIYLIRSFPTGAAGSSIAESLCNEIKRTLYDSEETFGFNLQPDGIFITEYNSDTVNYKQDMERILGISAKRTDLLSHTGFTRKNPALPWKPEQMDNALALALSEIEGFKVFNFLKGPFAAKNYWVEHKKSLIKTGILAGLVLALIFINIVLKTHSMEKKLAGLNNQITDIFKTTFPDVKNIVDPIQQMRVKLKEAQKSSMFSGETGKHTYAIDILKDISEFTPRDIDVNLTNLVVDMESVSIAGDTNRFNSVDDIKRGLEQSDLFNKVTISSANMNKSDNRVRFKLKVQL
ncbi:MAG: pilus assembly protein PilM [Desulfobacterales bacterium]|nr:pilus assembly protein PilM [Desulfobacterales bacterium]